MSASIPTAEHLADLRGAIPDLGTPQVFGDAELARFWVRAGGDHTGALILALDALSGDATKLSTYTIGQTREEQGQVFDHLERRIDRLRKGRGLAVLAPARAATTARGEFSCCD